MEELFKRRDLKLQYKLNEEEKLNSKQELLLYLYWNVLSVFNM